MKHTLCTADGDERKALSLASERFVVYLDRGRAKQPHNTLFLLCSSSFDAHCKYIVDVRDKYIRERAPRCATLGFARRRVFVTF